MVEIHIFKDKVVDSFRIYFCECVWSRLKYRLTFQIRPDVMNRWQSWKSEDQISVHVYDYCFHHYQNVIYLIPEVTAIKFRKHCAQKYECYVSKQLNFNFNFPATQFHPDFAFHLNRSHGQREIPPPPSPICESHCNQRKKPRHYTRNKWRRERLDNCLRKKIYFYWTRRQWKVRIFCKLAPWFKAE